MNKDLEQKKRWRTEEIIIRRKRGSIIKWKNNNGGVRRQPKFSIKSCGRRLKRGVKKEKRVTLERTFPICGENKKKGDERRKRED